MTTEFLVVLAVDMPLVTAGHLHQLCCLATPGTGMVPLIEGRAEPLCAIYPREAGPIFEEALPDETFSLQPIIKKLVSLKMLREMPVAGDARECYRSLNEPSDLD
jgi:molybdopterin-guanine dinucleotide biosynthesis protein A